MMISPALIGGTCPTSSMVTSSVGGEVDITAHGEMKMEASELSELWL